MFNELVIKNDPGVHLPQSQILVPENRTFHQKVLSKLCLNSNGKSNV